MTKAKITVHRAIPLRTITKQRAVRHLIHSAARMILAGEDPFAIHLLIQSADKLLIDLTKKKGLKLTFDWAESAKPEFKRAMLSAYREASNFLKHADKDYDKTLQVGEIVKTNILQLGICIVNYHGLFGEWTDHMKLLFNVAKLVSPYEFAFPHQRGQFDAVLTKFQHMTLGEFLNAEMWDDPIVKLRLPNLASEKAEDLLDTRSLHNTKIIYLQGE